MVTGAQSPDDWLQAGVRALRRGGFEAVRVEALARDLGVSKGSFYWHFRDRNDLVLGLINLWEAETRHLIQSARAQFTPSERLIGFFDAIEASGGYPPDTAIFELVRNGSLSAARVVATESKRIDFFIEQFEVLGLSSQQAAWASETVYCASLGWLEFAQRSGRGVDGFRAFATRVIEREVQSVPRSASGRKSSPPLAESLLRRTAQ